MVCSAMVALQTHDQQWTASPTDLGVSQLMKAKAASGPCRRGWVVMEGVGYLAGGELALVDQDARGQGADVGVILPNSLLS